MANFATEKCSIWKILMKTCLVMVTIINPNRQKSYKILQRLSPKHVACGIAQLPYPIYSHGKACLFRQLQWRAAGDPHLARGRSQVRAPAPAGMLLELLYSPPSLPPWGDSFFAPSPPSS